MTGFGTSDFFHHLAAVDAPSAPPSPRDVLPLLLSLLPLRCLLPVGLVQQLYLLAVAGVLLRLPPAVLPVGLHGVRYGDVDGLRLRVAAAGDEERVGGRLAQVAGHEAVLPPRVAQRRRAGVGRRLADVGDDGDAVHGLLVVADLQDLQVDLDVGVAHATSDAHRHPHSHLRVAQAHVADVAVPVLACRGRLVRAGLVAD